jgi:hypothetical protein
MEGGFWLSGAYEHIRRNTKNNKNSKCQNKSEENFMCTSGHSYLFTSFQKKKDISCDLWKKKIKLSGE